LLVLSDGTVSESDVSDLLGVPAKTTLYDLVDSMKSGDLAAAFDICERMLVSNVDLHRVFVELEAILQHVMSSLVSNSYLSGLPASDAKRISQLCSPELSVDRLASLPLFFSDAERDLSVNINNRWVLKAVVVKITKRLIGND